MSERHRPTPPDRRRDESEPFDLLNMLGPVESPDVTRAVMGRLGYMTVPARVARRQRLRRWGSRAGLTLATMLALGAGIRRYNESSRARQPLESNIPSALGNDLERHRQRFNDVIQTIRRVTPTPSATPSAVPEADDDEGSPVEDDVQRLAGLPMRWV